MPSLNPNTSPYYDFVASNVVIIIGLLAIMDTEMHTFSFGYYIIMHPTSIILVYCIIPVSCPFYAITIIIPFVILKLFIYL